MRIYAPTLECREEDAGIFDAFYNELESVIKNVKSRGRFFITGDFNTKIGTAVVESNI